MVGVEGVRYVGSHGLELAPDADRWRDELHRSPQASTGPSRTRGSRSRSTTARPRTRTRPSSISRRSPRGPARPGSSRASAARCSRSVRRCEADKGTAVTQLLDEAGLRRALYAGDDSTDSDAFRALDGLEVGVRVAVSSDEAPNELVGLADVVVGSPAELLTLLATL